jgi:hypothetical protein
MASREQAGIEQDEAGQALRSLGVTPSAENGFRPPLAVSPAARMCRPAWPPGAWPTTCPDAPVAVALATACCWKVAVHSAQECARLPGGIGFTRGASRAPVPDAATADSIASGTPDAHRAALASLVSLSPP